VFSSSQFCTVQFCWILCTLVIAIGTFPYTLHAVTTPWSLDQDIHFNKGKSEGEKVKTYISVIIFIVILTEWPIDEIQTVQTTSVVAPTAANCWWWVQVHGVSDTYELICLLDQIHCDKRTDIRVIYHDQVNLFRYSCHCLRQEPSIYSEYEWSHVYTLTRQTVMVSTLLLLST
jgi:hypothetical protein